MKSLHTRLRTVVVALALAVAALLVPATPALAATSNYSLATPGIGVLTFQWDGQFTATATPTEFQAPFGMTVIGVSGTCQTSGGTSPTLTMDVKEGGTSILSSAFAVTAGTVAEGTVSDTAIADEANVTIVFTIGGTSPTWDDCTMLITYQRK